MTTNNDNNNGNHNDSCLNKRSKDKTEPMDTVNLPEIDHQVKIKKPNTAKRAFDTAYKINILSAYDQCKNATERGALLRREGLYRSRIYAWQKQFKNDSLSSKKQKGTALRMDHLTRENEQLKKKLAQAEAIIELQKISELLGVHILPAMKSESN
jgi:hypothetical protein